MWAAGRISGCPGPEGFGLRRNKWTREKAGNKHPRWLALDRFEDARLQGRWLFPQIKRANTRERSTVCHLQRKQTDLRQIPCKMGDFFLQ